MSDATNVGAASGAHDAPRAKAPKNGKKKLGMFGRLALFVRQVIAELKKVVRPTRRELITYTTVVLVFVLIMVALIWLLDLGFGWVALRVFGGN